MPENSGMNLLVTGGTGFIGQHVLKELAARNVACHVLMRTPPTTPLPRGMTPLLGDMAAPLPEIAFTHCLHLAWGGLPHYQNPAHLAEELPKQQCFLEARITRGLRKLVVAGSCLEYGLQSGALDETAALTPTLPYTQAKAALLGWLGERQNAHRFDLCWARLFYMYGEGQHATSLFSQLSAAVARGDARFPMSHGAQQRDFLPVEQVARYLVDLLLLRGNHGVVNIGSGAPITVRAQVEQWLRHYGWSIALDAGHYPYSDYEPMAFWADTAKLNQLLRGVTVLRQTPQ
ncbi:MAG: NAD(P)-dependent oxidoreductase [Alphaproteobacteria bacterium]|nr:NAD(P)-dependent oxidoreductase [Alphaproteobacteria bacterium]